MTQEGFISYPCITLWQLWASLIAWQAKQVETRSWFPGTLKTGQVLAIHASKTIDPISWCDNRFIEVCIRNGVDNPRNLPKGAVLCLCRFGGAERTEKLRSRLSPAELYYGNYSDNRWGWKLHTYHVFETPIPAKGSQGLWQWTPPVGVEIPEPPGVGK